MDGWIDVRMDGWSRETASVFLNEGPGETRHLGL